MFSPFLNSKTRSLIQSLVLRTRIRDQASKRFVRRIKQRSPYTQSTQELESSLRAARIMLQKVFLESSKRINRALGRSPLRPTLCNTEIQCSRGLFSTVPVSTVRTTVQIHTVPGRIKYLSLPSYIAPQINARNPHLKILQCPYSNFTGRRVSSAASLQLFFCSSFSRADIIYHRAHMGMLLGSSKMRPRPRCSRSGGESMVRNKAPSDALLSA
jgi:hypothetical protein